MNEMARILTVVHFEHVHGAKVGMPLGKPLDKKNSLKKLRAPGRKMSRGPLFSKTRFLICYEDERCTCGPICFFLCVAPFFLSIVDLV